MRLSSPLGHTHLDQVHELGTDLDVIVMESVVAQLLNRILNGRRPLHNRVVDFGE